MRAAVLFFGGTRRDKTAEVARGLAGGLEKAGHQVDVIDGDRDVNSKLTVYEYIAVGTSAVSLFTGKIDPQIAQFLSRAGMVSGKKCSAFMLNGLFGSQKALRRLMAALEHEGMFIRYSDILRSREEAEVLAGRLKLQH
jgi:menaquinone-dependent protoporphyrinogen IX oxidase